MSTDSLASLPSLSFLFYVLLYTFMFSNILLLSHLSLSSSMYFYILLCLATLNSRLYIYKLITRGCKKYLATHTRVKLN